MDYSTNTAFKFSVKAILSAHDSNPRKRKHEEHSKYTNSASQHISPHYFSQYNYERPIARSRSLTPPQLPHRYSPPLYYRNNSFVPMEEKYYTPPSDRVQYDSSPFKVKRKNNDLNSAKATLVNYNDNEAHQQSYNDGKKQSTTGKKSSSPTGRFRPPPFFDTVLILRKRLYELGGKNFDTDEPPSDRNVHKLWRAVEKYKVDYSLQHYFYVASLSNRCFDLVDQIHQKVTRGLLEGSRDREVNQSYFNFLYGKNESEQYRLLLLLESGEMTPKDFSKVKKTTTIKSVDQNSNCSQCNVLIKKISQEKEELETKYLHLQQQYEKLVTEKSNSTNS